MNSALKPVLSSSTQSASQMNKPMHTQGTPATFGQPQNPYPNMNAAHNHPNAQQNHFSMGSYSMGSIPASNHPVASVNQTSTGQQMYNPPKNVTYSTGGFQGNIGHQQSQNTLPPVSQTLPPSTPPQQQQQSLLQNLAGSGSSSNASTPTSEISVEKSQSNGTPEIKTPPKTDATQGNHISPQVPQPAQVPQVPQVTSEKSKSSPLGQEQKPPPEPDNLVKNSEVPDTPPTPTSEPQKEATLQPDVPLTPDPPSEEADSLKANDENKLSDQETEEKSPQHTESSIGLESVNDEEGSETEKIPEVVEALVDSNKLVDDSPPLAKKDPLALTPPSAKSSTSRTRKARTPKPEELKNPKTTEPRTPSSGQKLAGMGKVKRQRTKTQPYQSPLPEVELVAKITSSAPRSRAGDDKLIYFYKNEFLAVRNAEGGFYVCQAVQNIYKSSSKIKIRWLSQEKNDKSSEIYTPDFYDLTDFDCILTSLDLTRVDKGKYRLKPAEKERTDSILKRCLAVEKGEITQPSLSEEHPDGLDLSLYKAEEQLKKKRAAKRRRRPVSKSPAAQKETPTKKTPDNPKVRKVEARSAKKSAPTPAKRAPSPAKKSTSQPPAEQKKPAATATSVSTTTATRSSRGKRKSDVKSSPVVDQKKAKVLAKIGRKVTASAAVSSRSQSKAKNVKASKPAPAPSKPVKASSAPATSKVATTRKTKRSSRK